ncbi:MAG: glycosyltransferase family 8 protein [Hyphomonadaceae bacterium]|nr:glycosyltransferase family 8 protein [Hyphomonadaceae bacterium]
MNGATIDVALGFDAHYAPHAAAVIASAVRAGKGARFRFIILHPGMTDEMKRRLESVAPGATFVWREINPRDLPDFDQGADLKHVNASTYLRLGLETLAPADCHRVIYLDADTVVFGDLAELWRVDLAGAPIGACPDTYVNETDFADRWGLPRVDAGYFNAGVLLIDMDRIRAERAFSKCLQFIRERRPVFADQDALNWVFWGRWRALDLRWNVQRDMVIGSLAAMLPAAKRYSGDALGVVHFTGKDKPWLREAWHPWAWAYWKHLARTGFLPEIANRHAISPLHRIRMYARYWRRRPTLKRAMA